jgi:hypothetical protein
MAELKPGVPVVFTTGYASEVSMVPIKTREKATVLQKPYGSHTSRKNSARNWTKGKFSSGHAAFRKDNFRREASETANLSAMLRA